MSEQNPWAAAPKFSSFKPGAAEGVEAARPERKREPRSEEHLERRPTPHRHRSSSRSRSRERHHRIENKERSYRSHERRHHHRHHRSRSRSREKAQLVRRQKSPSPLVPTPLAESGLPYFVLDRKGDVQNLTYGRLHRYDVPPFHRIGAGSVIGVNRRFRIERGQVEDDGIILADRRETSILKREKYVFARNEKKGARLLKIRPEESIKDDAASNADYVSLRTSRKRKRGGSTSSSSGEEERTHYRSIEGKAKVGKKPDDEALEYATESDLSDSELGRTIRFDEAIRLRSIELSRNVDKNPQDIDAWLALIDHQDALLGLSDHGRRKITTAEIQSTAEIKLDMYQKALKMAGSTLANRERLLLGLMAEGSKVWSPKEQQQRWEQISQDDLNSILLWKQYLDFRQSDFISFKYEEVRDLFQKRIRLLTEAINSAKGSEQESRGLYEQLIYTVLRAALYMRETGYTEISVAIWQVAFEFNMRGPAELEPGKSRLELFQEFWESEVPRIGEENARGWTFFISNQDTGMMESKPDEETPSSYLDNPDIMMGWALAEEHRSRLSHWPARTMDDTVEDDPYRVIMWSDIEGFMVDIVGKPFSSALCRLLIDAFLLFCRLPPVYQATVSRQWSLESFIHNNILDMTSECIEKQFLSLGDDNTGVIQGSLKQIDDKASHEQDTRHHSFQASSENFVISVDTLFPSSTWFRSLRSWVDTYGEEPLAGPVAISFVRETLKTLTEAVASDEFAEFYLAWMYVNQPQDIKKTAKSIIKQRPTSLRLYNAYALIEWRSGKKDSAFNIFNAALSMQSSLPGNEREKSIMLWRVRLWCLLDDGNNTEALKCLLAIPNADASAIATIDAPSPAAHMRAKQHLAANRDYHLSSNNIELACLHAECLALLSYLSNSPALPTGQGDISAALSTLDSFSSSLTPYSYQLSTHHELLHQSSARLLHHHIRHGYVPSLPPKPSTH